MRSAPGKPQEPRDLFVPGQFGNKDADCFGRKSIRRSGAGSLRGRVDEIRIDAEKVRECR